MIKFTVEIRGVEMEFEAISERHYAATADCPEEGGDYWEALDGDEVESLNLTYSEELAINDAMERAIERARDDAWDEPY